MKEYTIRMVLGHHKEISNERLNQFIRYHNENPSLWIHFKRTAHEIIGYSTKSSSKAIFEIIRYNRGKILGNDGFKINNNYTSLYSRLLEAVDPQFIGFFRYRGIKAEINDAVYERETETVHSV